MLRAAAPPPRAAPPPPPPPPHARRAHAHAPRPARAAATPSAAALPAAEADVDAFPGFPVLLAQRRSALTGAPIRVVALPEHGLLGGGGGLLGAPLPCLAGAVVLLLDHTSAVASVYRATAPGAGAGGADKPQQPQLFGAYWDFLAALPPLLPRSGALALAGLAGGTAAHVAHAAEPARPLLGWELDPDVVAVARAHMGLEALEASGALRVIVGDALALKTPPNEPLLAAIFVDLFAGGLLLPALTQRATWDAWLAQLAPGGRLLANLAGGSGDAEEQALTQAAFEALAEACGGELSVWEPDDEANPVQNVLALSGPPPGRDAWAAALPEGARHLAHGWRDAREAPA
jgi:hypothetical protein